MAASSTTLHHVGEWVLELRADTLEELFVEVARVVARAADPWDSGASSGECERIQLTARDHAALLVEWANELIGRSEVAGRAYGDIRGLVIDPPPPTGAQRSPAEGGTVRLSADVCGAPVDVWMSPVKAATYHGVALEREGDGWRARLLLDV